MSYTLNSANRDQTLTVGSEFSIAVTGDFRGGQLKLLFSTDGGLTYAPRDSRGEDVFTAPDVRVYDWSGDIKLLWEGGQGEVVIEVTEAGTATETINTTLQAVEENGRFLVEPLGIPGVARQLAAGAVSANTVLTSTCRRVSLTAVGADIRFMIGSTSQTADADTSHLILSGQTKDFALPATPNIAVIRDAATSGVLEVTELL